MNPLVIGLIIYSLIILGVGLWSARRNRTLDDYLLADRKLGPWVAAFSERASGESAWLLIGLPGLAYATGLGTVWVGVGCCTGIAFSWLMIARRLREDTERYEALTLADYFEARHHDHTRVLRLTATVIILFFFTFYVAAQFLAAGKVLNYYLNIPPVVGMLIGAVLVLFYTAAGGLLAVSWTDLVQGIIMLITLAVLPLAVMAELGGPAALGQKLHALGGTFTQLAPGQTGWAAFSGVAGSLAIGLGYMGQPHMARTFMPEWIAVVMICGAIAAMMSTADSQLLASASAISEDIYRKLINPDASQRSLVAIGRWATLAVGLVGFLLAWQAQDFVYDMVLYAWAGLGAAFGPPLLLSLHWRRTSRAGVLAGFLSGTAVVVIWYNVPYLKGLLYEMIPGFVVSLALTVIFSLLRSDHGPTTAKEGSHG